MMKSEEITEEKLKEIIKEAIREYELEKRIAKVSAHCCCEGYKR